MVFAARDDDDDVFAGRERLDARIPTGGFSRVLVVVMPIIVTPVAVTFHEPIPGFVVAFPAGVGDCAAGQQRGFGSQEPIGFEIPGRKIRRRTGNGRRRCRRRDGGGGGGGGRPIFVGVEANRFLELSVVVVVVVAAGDGRFGGRGGDAGR